MTFRLLIVAAVAAALLSSAAAAQTKAPATRDAADFTIEVWGISAADFDRRMLTYAALRAELQQGLPPLGVTDDPREINKAERALARRIRAARAGARGGEIFTPQIAAAFRHAMVFETRASTCASLLDDNPGGFSFSINGTYPKRKPLSTVPPGILLLLPRLPADVEYRFLGQHMILYDTRANIILDRILDAIDCDGVDD